MKLAHLDLFSGIGGFALALKEFSDSAVTTQFVEKDQAAQSVLKKRFPGVRIHDDIKTFEGQPAQFDLITAGYPCQDISPASQTRTGLEGDRSGLFFEVIRLIREIRPSYVILENSAALLTHRNGRDMRSILGELSKCGYDAQWSTVSACAVGAPHVRCRLFIVAYPNGLNVERLAFQQKFQRSLQALNNKPRPQLWASEPPDPRMANGLSSRVDRMRMIGNAVAPEAARIPLSIAIAMSEAAA